ncbi:Benzoate 4-monooxygenase [Cercospora beticola]|uniref:Benzoate 4-monooxygenase n=1 Tax=Cercospora beticola TaxID=122368 RepID=A0A2G5HDY0_CERBT|nr:Benzoate 4-monooxygenase [Cercospora beticola]PIA90442.1 Benzoate 4-monooxygenase [Cercospora beticola]WPB07740.1 hypothetical protein RHO25_012403 [Cercospora beticola]
MWLHIILISSTILVWFGYKFLLDPLRGFPGPFVARFSYAWRLHFSWTSIHDFPRWPEVHEKYGTVVRIGPKRLAFASAQAVQDIYSTARNYPKSPSYSITDNVDEGEIRSTLISSLDGEWHDRFRRGIASTFSLSSVLQFEKRIDDMIDLLVRQITSRFAQAGSQESMDLPRWMHYFAFDTVGNVVYGKPFGFLETGSDVANIIENNGKITAIMTRISGLPGIDRMTVKNPVFLWLWRKGYIKLPRNPVSKFADEHTLPRMVEDHISRDTASSRRDLFDCFLAAQEKNPSAMADEDLRSLGHVLATAGSDPLAGTLAALFYYLMKDTKRYHRLQEEVDQLRLPPGCEVVPFNLAHELTYLDECIKETFRIHPAASFLMERVVPASGDTIDGKFVPGGTRVSCATWAVHRQSDIFGDNVNHFIPERWLVDQNDAASQAKIALMSKSLLHFGKGRFICLGQHLALVEIFKVVPTLLRNFSFALEHPERVWKRKHCGVINVTGVDVRVMARKV